MTSVFNAFAGLGQAVQGMHWAWLLLTVAAYAGAIWLLAKLPRLRWLNPMVLSIAAVVLVLLALRIPYAQYFKGAQLIHELLGPATVALAIPLARQLRRMRGKLGAFAVAAGAGGALSIATGWLLAESLGIGPDALVPLSVKSVTMPIALAIADAAGSAMSLAAVFVMLTGLLGSVLAQPTLAILRLADARCIGFALGVCAHGIGVARAFQLNEETGSWAVLGMGMAAILAALILPLALRMTLG